MRPQQSTPKHRECRQGQSHVVAAKTHDNFLDKTSDRKKLSKVQYVDFCELRQDNGKVFVSKEIALGNSVRPKNVSPSANFMLNRHYINKSETKDHFKKPQICKLRVQSRNEGRCQESQQGYPQRPQTSNKRRKTHCLNQQEVEVGRYIESLLKDMKTNQIPIRFTAKGKGKASTLCNKLKSSGIDDDFLSLFAS